MKQNLLLLAIGFAMSTQVINAQVPNYVPTSGLQGWYSFTGNANDESGNGNNGTVNLATLTTDRFGNLNSAYSFNGVSSKITGPTVTSLELLNNRTVSVWIQSQTNLATFDHGIVCYLSSSNNGHNGYMIYLSSNGQLHSLEDNWTTGPGGPGNPLSGWSAASSNDSSYLIDNIWHNVVGVRNNDTTRIYIDGTLQTAFTDRIPNFNTSNLIIGYSNNSNQYFKGLIDDIGIWNRALTQQEINNLYNGGICYQLITVTDTLIINANLTGFNPITYQNTIKIWPNPTNSQITIDFGNYATLNGYTLKITNSLGQTMYTTPINQQTTTVPLSSWTGNGLYFVSTIDAYGNTIDIKKIVLQ